MWYPDRVFHQHKSKMTVSVLLRLKFRRGEDGKYLTRFHSETFVFKFLQRSWSGASSCGMVVTRMDTLISGWTHCVYYTTHQMMRVQVILLLSVFLEPFLNPHHLICCVINTMCPTWFFHPSHNHEYRDVIVFKKIRFSKRFSSTLKR